MSNSFAFRLPKIAIGHPSAFFSWVNSHVCASVPVSKANIGTNNLETIFETLNKEIQRKIHNFDYVSAQFYINDKETLSHEQYTNWAITHNLLCFVSEIRPGFYKLAVQSVGLDYSVKSQIHTKIPIYTFYSKQWFDGNNYHIQFSEAEDFTSTEVEIPVNPFTIVDYEYKQTKEVAKTCEELVVEVGDYISKTLSQDEVSKLVPNVKQELLSALTNAREFRGGFYEPMSLRFCINSIPVQGGKKYFVFITFNFGISFSQVLTPIYLEDPKVSNT